MYKNDMKNNKNDCFFNILHRFHDSYGHGGRNITIYKSVLFHDLFKNFYCDILKTKGKLKIMRDSITHMYVTHIMTTRNIKSVQ